MNPEGNKRWDPALGLKDYGKGKRVPKRKVQEEEVALSDVSEENFAPDWRWGPELKRVGRMTAATADHLLRWSHAELEQEEAEATVSLLEVCTTYGPFLAITLVMQVGGGGRTRLSKFGPNPSLTSFL
jgi:hypothetical protein